MRTDASSLPLPALLVRVLLAFALEFEPEVGVSLAICADVLRVVVEKGTPVRDLPMLGGISKMRRHGAELSREAATRGFRPERPR
jgi:hypothetical protein